MTKQRRKAIRESPFVKEYSDRDLCENVGICIASISAAFLVLAVIATCASAGEDRFGRSFEAGVSYSADVDQLAGLRVWQVREGMPGIWGEFRAGSHMKTATAGVTVIIGGGFSAVFGAGIHGGSGEYGANWHGGVMKTLGRLAVHAGYDTGPSAVSFGAGWMLW